MLEPTVLGGFQHSLFIQPTLPQRRASRTTTEPGPPPLEELCSAGILRRSLRRGIVLYQCDEVLDLVTLAERRLARAQKLAEVPAMLGVRREKESTHVHHDVEPVHD